MKLPILRSNPEDQILYQTERYNEETFGYEVPIKEEGDYVLVLKFAEVYFAQSQQKVRCVWCFVRCSVEQSLALYIVFVLGCLWDPFLHKWTKKTESERCQRPAGIGKKVH